MRKVSLYFVLVIYSVLLFATSGYSASTRHKDKDCYTIAGSTFLTHLILFPISLLMSKNKNKKTEDNATQNTMDILSKIQLNKSNTTEEPAPAPHSELHPAPSVTSPEPCIPDDSPAGKLVCVGLAHIGRKTALKNKYITDESETERYSIERPFLDLLSAKFKDDTQRDILRENFMLFKEACLLMIYRTLLKNNPDMHTKVKTMLRTLLSQNRTQADNQSRKEYLELFSKRFSYAYKKTKSTGKSLRYAFWNILAAKYPDWVNRESVAGIMNNDYLLKIFRYSYDALVAIDIVQFNKN